MEPNIWLMVIGAVLSALAAVPIAYWFFRINDRKTKDWAYRIIIAIRNGESLELPLDEKGRWTGGVGVGIRATTAQATAQAHPPKIRTGDPEPAE